MLVTMKELLEDAYQGGYAVCAANVWYDASTMAALDAAEEMDSPLILNYNYNPNVYRWMDYAKLWASKTRVPVAINHDHGATYEEAMNCIHAGFTSVMADRSSLPFEENIAQVAEIVKVAHACGVTVEGELGHVGSARTDDNNNQALYTDPDQAAEYVERTGVDCLAVAIGTAHGQYNKGITPKIDFERLAAIEEKVHIPLVLHGGSGSGDENLAKAAKTAICKINIFTDNHEASKQAIAKAWEEKPGIFLPFLDDIGYFAFKKSLKYYLELFGSAGKAQNYRELSPLEHDVPRRVLL